MIEWYDELYVDKKAEKNLDKYREMLENYKLRLPTLYCVALASNENNLFDVIACNELWFEHYRRNHVFVIGLATSYKNALGLLQEMVLDMYGQTGRFDSRKYFKNQP